MDGYEACRQIKANPKTKDIEVIFISAHDTEGEKIAGYEAGGSDYLIKPISPIELQQKIKVALANRERRRQLEQEKSMAINTAMTSMTSSGELGVVINFLRESFSVKDIDSLGRLLVSSLNEGYALDSVIHFVTSFGKFTYNVSGVISPLEQEILTRLKTQGRIVERDKRLILNFGDVSMLIKNMPVEDPDKCGRHRDNLAILIEGVEAKLAMLDLQRQHEVHSNSEIQQVVAKSNQALLQIKQKQEENKKINISIMDEVLRQLEDSFLSLGLTEEQEATLLNIVQNGVTRSLENLEQGAEADEQLHKIIELLRKISV